MYEEMDVIVTTPPQSPTSKINHKKAGSDNPSNAQHDSTGTLLTMASASSFSSSSPLVTSTKSSSNTAVPTTSTPTVLLSPVSRYAARRRMLEVDGRPLQHWNKSNFEPHRDETCRVVYQPKDGTKFFQEYLQGDDYQVMRRHSLLLEQPYFSKYNRYFPKRGYFACKACGNALYSWQSKFDANDGWPAFGTCIEGSVGVQTTEERQKQSQEEHSACIKIQARVRGVLCRIKVTKMLDDLIRDLLRQQEEMANKHGEGVRSTNIQSDGGNETASNHTIRDSNGTIAIASTDATTDGSNKNGKYTGRYTWVQELGEEYMELHCHRCKCHLGDIVEEENDGRYQPGQTFQERHRVNGRSLKYVEDDLPRRIRTDCSLLFANETQRRLLGLPDRSSMHSTKSNDNQFSYPLRTTPFISPRTRRRTLSGDRGVSFRSPRKDEKWSTMSNHSKDRTAGGRSTMKTGMGMRGRRSTAGAIGTTKYSLSVSCHERAMQVPFLDRDEDEDEYDDGSEMGNDDSTQSFGGGWNEGSTHSIGTTSTHSATTITSKPRRKKSISIRERKEALEEFILSKSMH